MQQLSQPVHIHSRAEGPEFFWSVMIPCYNPRVDYLKETLRSVLQQDPGRSEMQIEVIDDCSPNSAPTELVRKVAGDRVTVHREERNLGLAGIWNRCIERARGAWVHILHQDDLVMPGFYEKLKLGIKSPFAPGLAYCRSAVMNAQGHWLWLTELDAGQPGILDKALERFACQVRAQTPSVVVRRMAYEALGGFRSDLSLTLDWEMWCRIAARYAVWYDPAILACYRAHMSSETSRLRIEGKDIEDLRKCVMLINQYLPDQKVKTKVKRLALRHYAHLAVENAFKLFCSAKYGASYRQIRGALKCSVSPRLLERILVLGLSAIVHTARTVISKETPPATTS